MTNKIKKTLVSLIAVAGFALPGCGGGGSGSSGSSPSGYATEVEGDNALDKKLEEFTANSIISSYDINYKLDVNGTIIEVDARVIAGGLRAVIWYQGENDGDHAAEKTLLELYGIRWIQINPCKPEEIPAVLDDVNDNFWETGEYDYQPF